MLDTVRIKCEWPVKGAASLPRIYALNRHLRLGFHPIRRVIEWIEFSVPGILFGHNGQLIESQEQIDAALDKVTAILRTFAEVPPVAEWQVTRVDIAWNFALSFSLILAHAALRVPGIRRGAALFDNGVSWPGKCNRAPFAVKLYNKARKHGQAGSVIRAEVVWRGDQLRKQLPGQKWRDWQALWKLFRETMASIPPIPQSVEARTWPEAVSTLPVEYRNQVLACFSHIRPRTYRDRRQKVETAAVRLHETFSWAKILPPDAPPPAVHVVPKKRKPSQKK